MTKKFKHSGAFGDLIYGLPVMKHFGGGEFYLHLNQIDWIGQHYYGNAPSAYHQGRLTQNDFNYMKSFMEAQEYVTKFDVMTPQTEITHNLDRFRPVFVGHPGNYIDIYATVFGIDDMDTLRNTPWLTVPQPKPIPGRPIVINRTERWIPAQPGPQWAEWTKMELYKEAVFVGLPHEYEKFKQDIGWDIPYYECKTMLDLAEVIAGSENFIGNQSQALALAIGLGVEVACEYRTDLPFERNECYFPNLERVQYFN
jgi:hypothetical protein